MSTEEYLNYKKLIYKIAKRYIGINSLYELDDLVQLGAIGLAKAYNTYTLDNNAPFAKWAANNISWTIYGEINKKNTIDIAMSLYSPLGDEEGTILEEIIADNKINVQEEAESRVMMEYYYDLIKEKLNDIQADVLIYKFFKGYSNKDIEEILNIKGVSNHIREARMKLIRSSVVMKEEYLRIKCS